MIELTTLARPYAKAAFEFARDAMKLSEWSHSLSVASAVIQDRKVVDLMDSPSLNNDQKASALLDICGEEITETAKTFIEILSQNKRLPLLPVISEQFEDLKAQQERFADVTVVSAFDLNDKLKTSLTEKLKSYLSKDVTLTAETDKSLLGGAVIRFGDTVIDGSIKGRLNKLAENFGL